MRHAFSPHLEGLESVAVPSALVLPMEDFLACREPREEILEAPVWLEVSTGRREESDVFGEQAEESEAVPVELPRDEEEEDKPAEDGRDERLREELAEVVEFANRSE